MKSALMVAITFVLFGQVSSWIGSTRRSRPLHGVRKRSEAVNTVGDGERLRIFIEGINIEWATRSKGVLRPRPEGRKGVGTPYPRQGVSVVPMGERSWSVGSSSEARRKTRHRAGLHDLIGRDAARSAG